jgi:hypothetical protein
MSRSPSWASVKALLAPNGLIYDLKAILSPLPQARI